MRIAIQNPKFIFSDPDRNFNGYNLQFLKKYKPTIYFNKTRFAKRLFNLRHHSEIEVRIRKRLCELNIDSTDIDIVFDVRELDRKSDVLVCFNGRPDLAENVPPLKYRGMKVFHVMDYVFSAAASGNILHKNRVDLVMGYAQHDKYCPFFRKYYSKYLGKVIAVPFGFGDRFDDFTPFERRIKKVVALGSVNPVDDPAVADRSLLREYVAFYKDEVWTHRWRRILSENDSTFSVFMDSFLPKFPETKNFQYDAVEMLNRYVMFANDEGLMAFPPARTYEGVACGAVMVCASHPCFSQLGFVDGVNCIMHKELSVSEFKEKVDYYLENESLLMDISSNGERMVLNNYSHDKIASNLFSEINKYWLGQNDN